jgi:uncharacterized protein YggT (Ycf19 family)
MTLVKMVLQIAILAMMWVIFGTVVISWLRAARVNVPYGNPFIKAIEGTADLMLRPIRRNIPASGGGLDFSPVVTVIILYIMRALVVRL